jgi:hypothetical protein
MDAAAKGIASRKDPMGIGMFHSDVESFCDYASGLPVQFQEITDLLLLGANKKRSLRCPLKRRFVESVAQDLQTG